MLDKVCVSAGEIASLRGLAVDAFPSVFGFRCPKECMRELLLGHD